MLTSLKLKSGPQDPFPRVTDQAWWQVVQQSKNQVSDEVDGPNLGPLGRADPAITGQVRNPIRHRLEEDISEK